VDLRQGFLGHHLGENRADGGLLDRRAKCAHGGDDEHEGEGAVAREENDCHEKGDGGDEGVGEDDEFLAIIAIGPDAGEGGEEEGRQKPTDDIEGHHEAGFGLEGDVPEKGVLHQCRPEEGEGLAGKEYRGVFLPGLAGARAGGRGRLIGLRHGLEDTMPAGDSAIARLIFPGGAIFNNDEKT